jgi:FK506-binding nuclear protein
LKTDEGKAVAVDATEGGKDKKDKKKKHAEEKAVKPVSEGAEKKETKASTERTVAGGIVIEDAKTGTGPQAKKGNTVRMRYVGKLTNGKVFDKNTSGKPVRYHPSPVHRL